jgi:phospholipid/cholesterol/gamma-HCH transport system substrate-binding protein
MKTEAKVGLLFLGSVVGIVLFAYYLGVLNPFSSSNQLNIMYNYAGGLEEGSPVRVMGIKVEKLKKFFLNPSIELQG